MLVKRSLSLSGHRTSVALEPEFWTVLDRMAAAETIPTATLLARIDAERSPTDPLTSRLRVLSLQWLLTSNQGLSGNPAPR